MFIFLCQVQALQSQQQPISYIGRSFASEKDLRIWVAQEFGGLVNIHGKKFWRSGTFDASSI
jgi:hypothetical protein